MTISEYVAGVSLEEFSKDKMRVDATVRELEIVGEATKRLSDEFRVSHGEVPWQTIAGMRDILIHAYEIVDIEQVWRAATVDVPNLASALKPLLPAAFFEEES